MHLHPAHQTIIDAVIRKAEAVCPDSLALIGVYGSAATGDTHEKSDLDLLILINDDAGWQLGKGFILDDADVGYDIYCTNWEGLENEASCEHAHLSKLMDSRIVYLRDPDALERLENLKHKAAEILASDVRFEKAQALMDNVKRAYADCFLSDTLSQTRYTAGAVIHFLIDAVMLFHGAYFRKGVKRTFEELHALGLPFDLPAMLLNVICAENADDIRAQLTHLVRTVQDNMVQPAEKQAPDSGLSGTYEEMFSNWRNKMSEAAQNDDVFASFMNTLSCQFMLNDIAAEVEMQPIDLMGGFDPKDLPVNAAQFDRALQAYLEVYKTAGISPVHYADAQSFAADYLK